jgi:hypothetical protein
MKPKVDRSALLLDVKPVVAAGNATPDITIHWGANERRDGYHARRLAGLAGVDVVAYEGVGHNDLTRVLRDRGELRRILVSSIG